MGKTPPEEALHPNGFVWKLIVLRECFQVSVYDSTHAELQWCEQSHKGVTRHPLLASEQIFGAR
eukprot:2330111-Amphidinium_carterae.1